MIDERRIIRLFTISSDEPQTHYYQHIELFYLLGGSVDVLIDDQTYPMSADDFLIINANKTYSLQNAEGIVAARFEIDYNRLAEMLGTTQLFFWCNTVVDRNEAYDRCRDVMDKILIESYEREKVNELRLHAYFYQLLTVLTGNFLISQNEWVSDSADARDKDRMHLIQSYIQSNYQSQVSLNDLAKKLYLSNAYLSKYIKKNFGVTFVEYLNNVRMFHAVDELMYTDKNLTRIALDNGFPTSASFNRAFKEAYHVTPSEYRKKAQQDIGYASNESEESSHSAEKIRSILREKEHLNPQTEGIVENRVNALSFRQAETMPEKGINVKYANTLMRSEVQKEMLDISKECGLDYIRFKLVIDKNTEKAFGSFPDHHTTDLVLDFMVENRIKPFIVVEFSRDRIRRYELENSEENPDWFRGFWEQKEKIIRENMVRVVNRYGLDEIEKWNFEFSVWPEAVSEEIKNAFCYCFSRFFSNMKRLSENIRVGIGSFVLGFDKGRIASIITSLDRMGIQPDFVAFNSFQKISFPEIDPAYLRSSTDGNFIFNQIQEIREFIDDEGLKVKSIHINEWNHTTSNQNPFNDSCEQAAYILKNCIAMKGYADNLTYWHAIDSNNTIIDNGAILSGDSGIISRDGIRKPAFYAMSFFNKLLPYEMQRDEHGIVTSNGRNRFVIACCNFKNMTYANANIQEEDISPVNLASYLSNNEYLRLKYCIENVQNGTYIVKTCFMNQSYGSVLDIWKNMGYENNLAKEEVEYLRKSAQPFMEIKNIEVKSGVLEIENELAPQEIRLLDIQYVYK